MTKRVVQCACNENDCVTQISAHPTERRGVVLLRLRDNERDAKVIYVRVLDVMRALNDAMFEEADDD